MIGILDWIVLHPLASFFISLFILIGIERFHPVEKTYNFYTKEETEEDDEN